MCHRAIVSENPFTCTDFRLSGASCISEYDITGLEPHTRYRVVCYPESMEERTRCFRNFTTLEDGKGLTFESMQISHNFCMVFLLLNYLGFKLNSMANV